MNKYELTSGNLEILLKEYEMEYMKLENIPSQNKNVESNNRLMKPRCDNAYYNNNIYCPHIEDDASCDCDFVSDSTMDHIDFDIDNKPRQLKYDETIVGDYVGKYITSKHYEKDRVYEYSKDPLMLRGYYMTDLMRYKYIKYIINLNSIPVLEYNTRMLNKTLMMEKCHRRCMELIEYKDKEYMTERRWYHHQTMTMIRCLTFLNSWFGLMDEKGKIKYYDIPNEIIFEIFKYCNF